MEENFTKAELLLLAEIIYDLDVMDILEMNKPEDDDEQTAALRKLNRLFKANR